MNPYTPQATGGFDWSLLRCCRFWNRETTCPENRIRKIFLPQRIPSTHRHLAVKEATDKTWTTTGVWETGDELGHLELKVQDVGEWESNLCPPGVSGVLIFWHPETPRCKVKIFFGWWMLLQPMVNGVVLGWWFGIPGVPVSNNPFHKGIPGIQTTGPPNHQLTNSWLQRRCVCQA